MQTVTGARSIGALIVAMCVVWGGYSCAQAQPASALKSESFDRDPGWESVNNRIVPSKVPIIKQDFGYSPTNYAGAAKGELGGRVQRSSMPAYYVDKIEPKTLEEKLSASGAFVVKSLDGGGGGMMFGWSNSQQLPGSGDPNSFGLLLIFEQAGGRISVRLHNRLNQTCGTFVTPYIPGRYRPTPIRPGTRYHWSIDYDPQANKGDGQFKVCVRRADGPKVDDFEGLVYNVFLRPGFKKEGAVFDRFGATNARKTGGAAEIYFDDLEYSGKREDFATERSSWEGSGNRGEFKELLQPGAHDFGYSEKTSFAGGSTGEIGGAFWRTELAYGYYADKVGPLTLDDPIEASGKVALKIGSLDSDMALGFFSSTSKGASPNRKNFLGIQVGGPTRKGHMFAPACATSKGDIAKSEGPVLEAGRSYEWSMKYDPAANGGNGAITVKLGDRDVTLNLKPGQKKEGAALDRFGMFSIAPGGNLVSLYLDDLRYTSASNKR